MKIAVSANQDNLDSFVDSHFGRAPYFLLVDDTTLHYEAIQNPNTIVVGGAGIQSAQLVIEKGAKVVITGSCGPNAFRVLNAAGIKIYEGVERKVKDAIQAYKTKQLKLSLEATASSGSGKRNISTVV